MGRFNQEIDWEGKFGGGELDPVDPRVQDAVNKFRNALKELKKAQDPELKKVLREVALKLLAEAADVSLASNMRKLTKIGEKFRPGKN